MLKMKRLFVDHFSAKTALPGIYPVWRVWNTIRAQMQFLCGSNAHGGTLIIYPALKQFDLNETISLRGSMLALLPIFKPISNMCHVWVCFFRGVGGCLVRQLITNADNEFGLSFCCIGCCIGNGWCMRINLHSCMRINLHSSNGSVQTVVLCWTDWEKSCTLRSHLNNWTSPLVP